ncbi:MAG: ABC transporter ATP-binding protein [Actinomycetales bacterium]
MSHGTDPILSVRDLRVSIGSKEIVRGISFDVASGETVGIVGESGSGKSLSVLSATRLLHMPHMTISGQSLLNGQDLISVRRSALRRVHGREVGFVFQDPMTSLNPLLTIERQLTEAPSAHLGMTRRAARLKALELLDSVGIPNPELRLAQYPHQLSGGQRQRVMIAMALACDPGLLIADEPTTALDVTTQAQIIALVKQMQHERGMAVVWISHDLGVIGQVADNVTVMYRGEGIEQRPVLDIFDDPHQDYTRRLLASRPSLDSPAPLPAAPSEGPLLDVSDLAIGFSVASKSGKSWVQAVAGASFQINRGETLGLVGESGSGKSTIANALTGQVPAQRGTVTLDGVNVLTSSGPELRQLRRRMAMVFQDPFSAINPRMTVRDTISEPLIVHRLAADRDAREVRVRELLSQVKLPEEFADRYPHELSGGQRQRVCIARALACEPELLILDESTASLDVSIQAEVMTLLKELQRDLGLAFLFIAHDLAVVHEMSHHVMVMRSGEIVESRTSDELYSSPNHEYTKTLLAAIPPARPPQPVSRR